MHLLVGKVESVFSVFTFWNSCFQASSGILTWKGKNLTLTTGPPFHGPLTLHQYFMSLEHSNAAAFCPCVQLMKGEAALSHSSVSNTVAPCILWLSRAAIWYQTHAWHLTSAAPLTCWVCAVSIWSHGISLPESCMCCTPATATARNQPSTGCV